MKNKNSFKFYDKVAKKFGNYSTGAKNTKEFREGDPEKDLFNLIKNYAKKSYRTLDIGCGDGRYTLKVAPLVKEIIGIDLAKKMLQSAEKLKRELKVINAEFKVGTAYKFNFLNNSFDIVIARRSPYVPSQVYRTLKFGGNFFTIGIGELDCKELKLTFGRGQNYGAWGINRKLKAEAELEGSGMKIIFSKSYLYTEFYQDYYNLDLFLQGVPIFTDYDSEKDKPLLTEYVKKNKKQKGISLPRHRYVIVAKK